MEEFENQHPKPLSVKDWLVTLLLMAIPVVGIVLLFVYAFGSNENPNRQNWAKAQLIMMAIIFALVIFMFIVFGSIFAAAMATQN
jgi:chromate transport protein ChrA